MKKLNSDTATEHTNSLLLVTVVVALSMLLPMTVAPMIMYLGVVVGCFILAQYFLSHGMFIRYFAWIILGFTNIRFLIMRLLLEGEGVAGLLSFSERMQYRDVLISYPFSTIFPTLTLTAIILIYYDLLRNEKHTT